MEVSFVYLLAFFISLHGLQAQSNTIGSGGEATGSGGAVSYSVGQVVYTTNTGTNGSVAQGVEHPYEIYTVGIEETDIQYYLTAFPNPTTDNLKLKIDVLSSEMYYQLFDIQGKLLENKKIISNEATISMASFVSATYFFKIIANNTEVKQFIIIKN